MEIDEKLSSIISINKGKRVKINYELLKKHLRYEDYFYETVLEPMCKESNVKISFDKEFIILESVLKEEKNGR